MLVLGIESSCDETSLALIEDGTILSSRIFSQTEHSKYGGVVPEIASRAHVQKISLLAAEVFNDAAKELSQASCIAVTDSPGLAGALLVGVSFALGMAEKTGARVIGVNHLEGHIFSPFIESPEIPFPFIALIVSGGHTALYHVHDVGRYTTIGMTVDDAAGEAFDKVGKLLGFSYPAGRAIEEHAAQCADAAGLKFPLGKVATSPWDFSFSGLKTAVKYHVQKQASPLSETERNRICCSFQSAVVHTLVEKLNSACISKSVMRAVIAGGVACNGALRARAAEQLKGIELHMPPPRYCTDNAAMIARVGWERERRGLGTPPHMSPSRQI